MAKARGTDGSLLPSLPWTLASLALALLPHVQYLPVWITAAFITSGTWRYLIEKRRGALPSTWPRAVLALVCFLGVLFEYSTISGVGPGSALLAVMASLKLLETHERRDQFVLLFIAIFLVMSSLLREQYLWSLPYLLVALIVIMTAWLRMSAAPTEPLRRSFRTGTRLITYAAPMALAMWFFFPRISTPFWAVPIDTSSGVSGLSDTMNPGDISSLSQSNAVAFRVKFDGEVPASRDLYWRGLVLYKFDGRAWTGSEPMQVALGQDSIRVQGDPIRYNVTLEPTRQHWVFALDVAEDWDLDHTFRGRFQELARTHAIDQRISFNAVSYTNYQAEPNLRQWMQDAYVELPDGTNPETVKFAQRMRAETGSDSAYIEAVLAHFHNEEFFYTLNPPTLGRNPVDRFLFNTQRGFCEHYSSAFSVLMRAVGIPTRIVLGYQGGELNPVDDRMIVRQSDAHAWSEVWFEDVGWTRVDPTAAVAPERIEMGFTGSLFDGAAWGLSTPSEFLHQIALRWDALNAGWNDWVLGYGPDKQDSLMRSLGMDDPSWRNKMLTLIALVVALTLIVGAILMLRYRPPPRDRAAILYRRFVRKSGIEPAPGETPNAFALRANSESTLGNDTIHSVTTNYLEARYGQQHAAALTRLERDIAAIR